MADPSRQMVPELDTAFGAERYGESFADVYDEWYDDVSDAEATATFLGRFGQAQSVLELGVGTGRLSTAISSAGHSVIGVDSSTAMLKRFRGDPMSVAAGGDMRQLPIANGSFDLVLIATNTLLNLNTAAAQHACIAECRRALRLGGRLIIEAMVPGSPDAELDRLVTTRSIDVDSVVLTATIRDSDQQLITGQHIQITESGIRLRPWKIRYMSPAELDDMCRAAGFQLGDRLADWDGRPFDDSSTSAVSVYVAI